MRDIKEIEKDLAEAKEMRDNVKGMPAEVYSRIVGYYRSVRNWNRGKREEYNERCMFKVSDPQIAEMQRLETKSIHVLPINEVKKVSVTKQMPDSFKMSEVAQRILLFVRQTCPNCSPAKDAAGSLGIPVDLVNTDTEDGLKEAARYKVMSTPTAILLAAGGEELARARDSGSIAAFGKRLVV